MEGTAPVNQLRLSFTGSEDGSRNGNLQSGEAPVANKGSNLRPARAQLTEPPYADPHVLLVWQGRAGDRSPYADPRIQETVLPFRPRRYVDIFS
jgi:hypothetical protein